jgi:hypothetical protein
MHTTHVASGGRYPVLRSLAILYLIAAAGVLIVGVWRAVNALVYGDQMANDVFGASTGWSGRIMVSASWLAATFIGVLAMFAVAEFIKLFIDIEHNTRIAGLRAAATNAGMTTVAVPSGEGAVVVTTEAVPSAATDAGNGAVATPAVGGRMGQWLEGEETAEGALIRGH